jgi:hypothetical protein
MLESLYEMAYMRMFAEWEVFLEETFLRMLCGYVSPIWVPSLYQKQQPNLASARQLLLGNRGYVLWWSPQQIRDRAKRFFVNSPHEIVVTSSFARLGALAAVRHRLGHGSDQVRQSFDAATMLLAGRRYKAGSVGRFLRDWHPTASPAERWLFEIERELVALSAQIAP